MPSPHFELSHLSDCLSHGARLLSSHSRFSVRYAMKSSHDAIRSSRNLESISKEPLLPLQPFSPRPSSVAASAALAVIDGGGGGGGPDWQIKFENVLRGLVNYLYTLCTTQNVFLNRVFRCNTLLGSLQTCSQSPVSLPSA